MSDQAALVVATLKARSVSLAVAESLTGGLLGASVTAVPGSSAVFVGGITAYATALKTSLLGVPSSVIARHTVVSEQVAHEMAVGLQERTGADWVIAVTGVAGPDPQDGHAPGEVFICVLGPRIASLPQLEQIERFEFAGDRDAVRRATIDAALEMLLRLLSPV